MNSGRRLQIVLVRLEFRDMHACMHASFSSRPERSNTCLFVPPPALHDVGYPCSRGHTHHCQHDMMQGGEFDGDSKGGDTHHYSDLSERGAEV